MFRAENFESHEETREQEKARLEPIINEICNLSRRAIRNAKKENFENNSSEIQDLLSQEGCALFTHYGAGYFMRDMSAVTFFHLPNDLFIEAKGDKNNWTFSDVKILKEEEAEKKINEYMEKQKTS